MALTVGGLHQHSEAKPDCGWAYHVGARAGERSEPPKRPPDVAGEHRGGCGADIKPVPGGW